MPHLTREQRRMRRLNRLETTAFWVAVLGGLGLFALFIGAMS